ncbi:aromatic acid/H+ symport family MFS transporter [Corynebacterium frankenforstense]|uniref:MFS transporter n=1 Tax=Corynebacterium frankenforstense TaxID=1230998 RepID=UPI00254B11B8|nr:aromatic acid/H+ symport family MFS transporter [Corynebacterium frankenforstense]MDK6259368.1 aromatic acid/H+ symport family MFS transporter [Corynebacterium frankenforstense]
MGTTTRRRVADQTPRRAIFPVVGVLWIAAMFDGFDLVILGTVLPSMLEDPEWHLTAGQATQITTAGLVGMMFGAMTAGWLTDHFGRKWVVIFAVASFSALTVPLGFHPSVTVFIVLRFIAGAGLGGCLPIGMALLTEFRGGAKAGSASTTLMTGYHVGAVLTALLGLWMLQDHGWPIMFIIGGVAGLVLVPFMIWLLPESPQYLMAKGREDEARRIAALYDLPLSDDFDHGAVEETKDTNSVAALFTPTLRRNTVAIWGASFMGLLLVYGLNTWLPQIMRAADYPIGSSIGFLLVLNVGAVVGLWIAGAVADRSSPRVVSLIWFTASAVFLALLAVRMPMVALYGAVFITGVFVFSSQVMIYAFTAANHPAKVRATAMGFSAGIGRLGAISGPLLAGTLAATGHAYPWGFFGFAAVGALGAVIFSTSHTLRNSSRPVAQQEPVAV